MKPDTVAKEQPKHEPSDLNARAVLMGVAAVIAMLLLAAGVAAELARHTRAATNTPEASREGTPSLLTSNPSDARAAFEREKLLRLNSYGWVDQKENVAHIPIESAMHLLSAPTPSASEHP
jgi:hypothetical protein